MQRIGASGAAGTRAPGRWQLFAWPCAVYLGMTLGVPALRGGAEREGYAGYTLLTLAVSATLLLVWLLIRNLLFTIVIPGTVGCYVPLFAFAHGPAARSPMSVPGVVVLAVGAAIYAWCGWDFATAGRGTPFPLDPPRHLVMRGLYRYVRNPMYVGVLTVIAGWALLFGSATLAIYGICVALGFHLFVLLVEEPVLRRKFGEEYVAYCARVRRWVPRVPREG